VPQLKDIANGMGEQVMDIPSQDMNDAAWLKLAKRLQALERSDAVSGQALRRSRRLRRPDPRRAKRLQDEHDTARCLPIGRSRPDRRGRYWESHYLRMQTKWTAPLV
jgi:hypothetical protein